MCVRRWIWASLICLSLAACSGSTGGSVSRSDVPELVGGWSAVEVLSQTENTRHHVILARGYVIEKDNRLIFTIRLGKHWDGVHRHLDISDIRREGKSVPFKPATWSQPFTHDMAPYHKLIGTLMIDNATFQLALRAGLTVQASGQDGSFNLIIPARLFINTLHAAKITQDTATSRIH